MMAPLKVSLNHIAATFLTAQTMGREQVEPRARLRGLSHFADGDLLPTSMQPSAAYRRKIIGASCVHGETRPGFTGQGTMIYSDELLAVAKRIFWFGTPEEAVEN
jgi:hypothetical protein